MTYKDLSIQEKRKLLTEELIRDGATKDQAQSSVLLTPDFTIPWYLEQVFGYKDDSPIKE
jgi:hypothetical protein